MRRLLLEARPERRCHAVERIGEGTELVSAPERNPMIERARGERSGAVRQHLDWYEQPSKHDPGEQHGRDERERSLLSDSQQALPQRGADLGLWDC